MNNTFIGAIIITFNPNIERLGSSIKAIAKQVDLVLLVDNGSKNIKSIEECCGREIVLLKENHENFGIAKALNQGFRELIDKNCDWILTLDQDTICSEGMIDSFKKHISDGVGIICPAVYYKGKNILISSDKEVEEIEACMTSANLVNVQAWKAINGFNEDYFIDFVDNDFCMRLRIAGYRILRDWTKYIEHELGSIKEYHIGKKKFQRTIHSPLRYYYMTRNNLYFIRNYKKYLNPLKEYCRLMYVIGRELPFSDQKNMSMKYVIRGIRDFKHDVVGPLEEKG